MIGAVNVKETLLTKDLVGPTTHMKITKRVHGWSINEVIKWFFTSNLCLLLDNTTLEIVGKYFHLSFKTRY